MQDINDSTDIHRQAQIVFVTEKELSVVNTLNQINKVSSILKT